jgi:hypothetical protein
MWARPGAEPDQSIAVSVVPCLIGRVRFGAALDGGVSLSNCSDEGSAIVWPDRPECHRDEGDGPAALVTSWLAWRTRPVLMATVYLVNAPVRAPVVLLLFPTDLPHPAIGAGTGSGPARQQMTSDRIEQGYRLDLHGLHVPRGIGGFIRAYGAIDPHCCAVSSLDHVPTLRAVPT